MNKSNDTVMKLRDWAVWMGWASAGMAYQAKKEGRLVLAADGKNLLAEASKRRYLETGDPSKRGVTERHAAERLAPVAEASADAGAVVAPDEADPATEKEGYHYQNAKAKREHWAAEREHAAFRKEAGELIEVGEHITAFASAGALVRAALESWIDTLPPQLAGREEGAIRTTLADQVEQILRDMSQQIGRAALSQETET